MTTYSINATFNHPEAPAAYEGCYSYDDPVHGVVGEPIVHDASQVIITAFSSCGTYQSDAPPTSINLTFTDSLDEAQQFDSNSLVLKLSLTGFEDSYKLYDHEIISPERAAINSGLIDQLVITPPAPLCPHLLDYFDESPTVFYVKLSVPN